MNFLLLSIVSCLLLSNINYASEKPTPTRWSFPVLTAMGILKSTEKSESKNAIPKNLSEKALAIVNDEHFWATVDNDAIEVDKVDRTLIEDYFQQNTTATSPTTSAQQSPTRIRSESISVLHTTGSAFELCDNSKITTVTPVVTRQLTTKQPSLAAVLFSKTTGEPLDTSLTANPKIKNDQTIIDRICGCCFKKKAANS